jgi:hypothetical protein
LERMWVMVLLRRTASRKEGKRNKMAESFATVTSADLRPLAYKGLFSKRTAPRTSLPYPCLPRNSVRLVSLFLSLHSQTRSPVRPTFALFLSLPLLQDNQYEFKFGPDSINNMAINNMAFNMRCISSHSHPHCPHSSN